MKSEHSEKVTVNKRHVEQFYYWPHPPEFFLRLPISEKVAKEFPNSVRLGDPACLGGFMSTWWVHSSLVKPYQ